MEVNQFTGVRRSRDAQTQALEIAGRQVAAICLRSGAADFGQLASGLDHEGGLIALAAMGDGGEIGASVSTSRRSSGRDARGLADGLGFGKGQHAAEAEVEAEIERFPGLRVVAGEAVHDAAAAPVLAQDLTWCRPRLRGCG